MAVSKGWWPADKRRTEAEIFNNMHSEISEAWEEYRRGRMLPWHESRDVVGGRKTYDYGELDGFDVSQKPEGFSIELADFVIRLADWCGSIGVDSLEHRDADIFPRYNSKPEDVICFLHKAVDQLFDVAIAIQIGDDAISDVINLIGASMPGLGDLKDKLGNRKIAAKRAMISRAAHASLSAIESFTGISILWSLVNLKLKYNSSRPIRHGGLLA